MMTPLFNSRIERMLVAAVIADPTRLDTLGLAAADLQDFHAKAALSAVVNVYARNHTPTTAAVRAELAAAGMESAVSGLRADPYRGWFDELVAIPLPPDPPIAGWTDSILRLKARRDAQVVACTAPLPSHAPPDDIPPPSDKDAPPDAAGSPKRKRSKHLEVGGPVGMATDYISRFAMHPDGPTLRRWRGDWYCWTPGSGRYVCVTDERIEATLYRDLRLTRPADVRDVRSSLIAVDGVLIDEVQLSGWIGDPAIEFPPLEMAACPNGLLHLPSRTLYQATPRYFATTSLGVNYEREASAPKRWPAFLRQLWRDDDQSIAALQEWFGYLLTPDTRQQKIMLLIGPKRSGKGTIGRVLKALLGGDSVAAPTLASLGTNFGLWPLIGRTAAIIGDARLGGRSDIAQIVERLLSISGQDAQTIDRKHREPWNGYLSARMMIISNELPRFTDASDALASRMLILELERSFFGQEDTNLSETVISELPGILAWALDGWDRLRGRGHFVQPSASAGLADDLTDLASPVAAWVRERCDRGDGYEVDCDVAFNNYQAWATKGNHDKVTLTKFGGDLKAAAQVKRVQVRNGSVRSWVYRGIRLRP